MEVKIGDYGRMIFEMMTGKYKDMPEHWQSISAEAEPLIRQLIDLNSKMKNGSYTIVGYKDKNGKEKLSKSQRIKKAQKTWETAAETLKVGDKIWLNDGDHEMYVGQNSPVPVIEITDKNVYIEMSGCNCEYTVRIGKNERVLKAPDDFAENEEVYESGDFWLEQADEMGI